MVRGAHEQEQLHLRQSGQPNFVSATQPQEDDVMHEQTEQEETYTDPKERARELEDFDMHTKGEWDGREG